MRFPFSEAKATQVAAMFLSLHGRRMKFLRLIKLMYIADRNALRNWDRPITGDRYVSMNKGPVLSRVYDFIKGHPDQDAPYWDAYISKKQGYFLSLIEEPDYDELSRNETDLIRGVYTKYGNIPMGSLIDYLCHKLPEWEDPGKSSFPIEIDKILQCCGRSETDITRIREEAEHLGYIHGVLG